VEEKMGIFEFDLDDIAPNTETRQWGNEFPDFDDNLLFGYFFKDIAILLLDKCGYEVYPFGYESFFPTLKRQLYDSLPSEVAGRIRSTPDLLVRNPHDQRVELVEVKARSAGGQWGITIKEIDLYHKFWLESILILIIPTGNYFYAQRVAQLEPTKTVFRPQDFYPIEEIFHQAKELPEDFRRKIVQKVVTLFFNRDWANL